MDANFHRTSYDAICEQWHVFRKQTTVPPCLHQFADHIRPGGHILDIGCGMGFPLDTYLPKCCKKQMHWPYPKHSFCSVMC